MALVAMHGAADCKCCAVLLVPVAGPPTLAAEMRIDPELQALYACTSHVS